MSMEEKVVLFGTGEDLKKCLGILREQGIEPYCFTDNDSAKWGTMLEGKRIIAPADLAQTGGRIMITTSDYKVQIRNQLKELGLEDRILEYEPIFRKYVDAKADSYRVDKIAIHDRECILLDAFMGRGWDGDQQYACYVASCLKERGYDTHVYARESLVPQSDATEELIDRFPWQRENYWDTVLPIIKDMEQWMPFVLIANTLEYVMVAAYVLKRKYPDKVRIISVVHNDLYSLYEKQAQWQDCLEAILGISKKIEYSLKNVWNIPEEKVRYRVNPVFWVGTEASEEADIQCNEESPGEQIRIGWGGRLTSSQKNANLLPVLIEALERKEVRYYMEIAGDGSYYANIKDFLDQKGLSERVCLRGRLTHKAMREFWKQQQVYINLSTHEGCCLAMLEAMECGAVPVVTDVSGVEDVVCDGQTGFRVGIGEIEQMAERIAYLAENPEERKKISRQAIQIVKERCDLKRYIDYIEELVQ